MKTTLPSKQLALVFAGSLLLGVCVQAAASREDGDEATFTTIDFPDATLTQSYDIDAAGMIVGRYVSADGRTHGYLRNKKGEFTTIDFPDAVFTTALGINRSGDIVGNYRLSADNPNVRHGYLLSEGEFTTFDIPVSGTIFTQPFGINARGDIVGRYRKADDPPPAMSIPHGFLRSREGEFIPIDFPDAILTNPWKITAAGQIVGAYQGGDLEFHIFLLTNGSFITIPDFPGAIKTPPEAGNGGINRRGDIVSFYCDAAPCRVDNGSEHGFLLSRGEFTAIDFPGATWTAAFGINRRRDIVGSYLDTGGNVHGFLLSREVRDEDKN
jgi:uncharacterized membrane protein